MNIELQLAENMNFLYNHKVKFMTIEVPEEKKSGKSYYLWDNKFVNVEIFAKKLFEANGYKVVQGTIVKGAYGYLSYNRELITDEYLEMLSKEKQFGKTIHAAKIQNLKVLRKRIKALKLEILERNQLDRKIIDYAIDIHRYTCVSNSRELERGLFEIIKTRSDNEIISLIKFFDKISGLSKGTPDLFIYNDNEFAFVEVKSDRDSLSKWQNCFIHFFHEVVGENIIVLNIVNDEW